MANWYGTARSNYFRVRNPEIFKTFIEEYVPELEVSIQTEGDNVVAVFVSIESDSGGWPTWASDLPDDIYERAVQWASLDSVKDLPESEEAQSDEDDDESDEAEIDLPALIAPFLLEGEVAVLMESGAEKLRYVTGSAVAFNRKAEVVSLSLGDIYALAKEKLGGTPTRAEY